MRRLKSAILLLLLIQVLASCMSIESVSSEYASTNGVNLFYPTQDVSGFSLRWTSNWNSTSQSVDNDTVIVGDHIILNATFNRELLGMNISRSELRLIHSLGSTFTAKANGNCICLDTYYVNRMNMTYDISAIGYNEVNESIEFSRKAITLCNFFAPELKLHIPVELPDDYLTLNISWDCIDLNEDEVNFFDVFISSDSGESYLLLARNLTVLSYIWNSTGFLERDYYIRVRAYSHDISIQELNIVPDDYWPGDYADDVTQHAAGSTPIIGPPPGTPTLNHPENVHYTEGTTGHSIIWEIYSNYPVAYNVWRNSTLLFSSVWNGGSIVISVDGLSTGVYEFRLNLVGYDDDIVFVFVGERSSSSIHDLMSMSVIIIGFGSTAIILASVILIIRHKRRFVVFD